VQEALLGAVDMWARCGSGAVVAVVQLNTLNSMKLSTDEADGETAATISALRSVLPHMAVLPMSAQSDVASAHQALLAQLRL
jgi:hypothetical protein